MLPASLVRTKSFDLLPDELVHPDSGRTTFLLTIMICFHIALLINFLHDTSKQHPYLISMVCHRWRRVVVPSIIYETVILISEAEANAFASIVRRVGFYIKKLRIEGGYGQPIYPKFSRIHLDSHSSVSPSMFLQKARRVVFAEVSNSSTLSS